jgi:hypothetical protein
MPRKLPKGRSGKPLSGKAMYELGTAYRERAEKLQRRPATVVESAKARLDRDLKAVLFNRFASMSRKQQGRNG